MGTPLIAIEEDEEEGPAVDVKGTIGGLRGVRLILGAGAVNCMGSHPCMAIDPGGCCVGACGGSKISPAPPGRRMLEELGGYKG